MDRAKILHHFRYVLLGTIVWFFICIALNFSPILYILGFIPYLAYAIFVLSNWKHNKPIVNYMQIIMILFIALVVYKILIK